MQYELIEDRIIIPHFNNKEEFRDWYYANLVREYMEIYNRFLLNRCLKYKSIWYNDYLVWRLQQ
jgi:hypothetical protein